MTPAPTTLETVHEALLRRLPLPLVAFALGIGFATTALAIALPAVHGTWPHTILIGLAVLLALIAYVGALTAAARALATPSQEDR